METYPPPVTVVVINYNGKNHLADCLGSIEMAEGPIQEVILVDDGSFDGSAAWARKHFSRVKIIEHHENLGPAAARNSGLARAKTDFVCFLDNDLVVARDWLSPLVRALSGEPAAALASGRIMRFEQPDTIGTDGLDIHFLGMPTLQNAGKKISHACNSKPRETVCAGGACILIDKTRLDSVFFDPDFFYGFEDTDFCLNLRFHSKKCIFSPRSQVFHKYETGGVVELSDQKKTFAKKRAFYIFRNRWFIIIKYFKASTILALLPSLLFFEIATIFFSLKKHTFGAWIEAMTSLIENRKTLLRKRKKLQKIRKTPDSPFLSAADLSLGQGTASSRLELRAVPLLNLVLKRYWKCIRGFIK